MTILPATLHKRLAIGLVLERRIGLAPIAVTRNTIPFKVTQMGDGPARPPPHLRAACAPRLRIEPDYPRLDHHSPRSEAASGISLPPALRALPRKRGNDLRAPATRVK